MATQWTNPGILGHILAGKFGTFGGKTNIKISFRLKCKIWKYDIIF